MQPNKAYTTLVYCIKKVTKKYRYIYRYNNIIQHMKSKGSIDTYNTIYPIDFIVASNSIKLVDLQKLLQYSDKTELDDDIL